MYNFKALYTAIVILPAFVAMPSTALSGEVNQCAPQTISGNYNEPEWWNCVCPGGAPSIVLSGDTVTRNNHVNVWVDSEGLACPPYEWEIEVGGENGFHFNSSSGPHNETTESDLQVLELWADADACGSAIIKVTDRCGEVERTSVREPDHGHWETCISYNSVAANCTRSLCDEYTAGRYKVLFHGSWSFGKNSPVTVTCEGIPFKLSLDGCNDCGTYYDFPPCLWSPGDCALIAHYKVYRWVSD